MILQSDLSSEEGKLSAEAHRAGRADRPLHARCRRTRQRRRDDQLGAIHALDRIAPEDPQARPGVTALLATYVRRHAHRGWTSRDEPELPLRSRASDIQAALSTLTNSIAAGRVPPQWLTADLAHTDLPNANLNGCTLWHVRMRDVSLTGAGLGGADLRGADLREAVIDDAAFTGTHANLRTLGADRLDPRSHGITIDQSEAAYDR